ncbi:MAG: deoxynucleoside kinase [Candidatus Hodarchaeota archaeon]
MVKIISFEGGIGVGKTSLTNYFSYKLKMGKILEKYDINPFLKEFYEGDLNINLETEFTFLLIHYSQLKKLIKNNQKSFILADFSIEKDLVYAKLNLNKQELSLFEKVYNYVINEVGLPKVVIYLDLSLKILKRIIFQRGRTYEINADPKYFKDFNDKIGEYFKNESKSKVYFINVDELVLDPDNRKLQKIRDIIVDVIK